MARKRPLFRILILVIFGLSTVSCSRLVERFFLQAEIADTGWVLSAEDPRSYKFQCEGVTLVICPVHKWDWMNYDIVSLGPPLFPIIPTFRSGERKRAIGNGVRTFERMGTKVNLEVQIGVVSATNISKIDFSKVRVEFPGGKSLPPSKISGFEEIKECPSPWGRNREQIQIEEVGITNKRMYFLLEFDIRLIEIEEFALDLGHLSVNDKNIKLPPLKYKEVSQYRYHPFFIPMPK